ncbi:GNAT family N-acetyltransferase [Paenibacillus solani]|uniref:GNAT family N-acetyltransferase n=1 Tax=Paenibacillus solani TaxID=1705565 RepID=UPI003D2A9524
MITIQPAPYQQKSTLRNLMELYQYDFSEFEPDDVNENGLYEYMFLDHYWTEDGRHPFFIRVNACLAGFALVRELGTTDNDETIYSMAEFFVMKKYRKNGIGQYIAVELFNRFQGIWKVAVLESNKPAQKFWRKTIERYTNNRYQVIREEDWDGPIQIFSSAPPREVND